MSKYQRRHFEQFARIISDMRSTTPGLFDETYIQDFTERIASTFSRENTVFNRETFLRACGDPRAKHGKGKQV